VVPSWKKEVDFVVMDQTTQIIEDGLVCQADRQEVDAINGIRL